jgi:signal transduction histidine kinase/DNA-binding NarL/FixJ family response regulator
MHTGRGVIFTSICSTERAGSLMRYIYIDSPDSIAPGQTRLPPSGKDRKSRKNGANLTNLLIAREVSDDTRVGLHLVRIRYCNQRSPMNDKNEKLDYLSANATELAVQRRGKVKIQHESLRAVARQLLPACFLVPTLLWWALFVGIHRGWYRWDSCFILFVYAVAAAFGGVVWHNLQKLKRMDTQRHQVEEQLKLTRDAAEAANRFKSLFFANISHEIRTPLTAINGFAELLMAPERSEAERIADARIIRRNGEHLLSLINDILDLSKIEAGKMSIEEILCSPAGILGEVTSLLRHRAEEKGLKLEVAFEGQFPKMIRTDPTRLRQVLINLLSNAIKFTKHGSVRLAVSIKPALRAVEPKLEIKITDTGIGIPAERLQALFKPFVQADTTITRQYGGSGLGLAISQHFARALGGDISVTSEENRGSIFTVTVATGPLGDAAILDNPEKAMEAQDDFTHARVKINGTVLVAEDGIDNQALIATRLREMGLKLEIANNGQIAVEKALAAVNRNAPYDLILMDVQMPIMDGFTATQELRGKGYRGPIIALTANAMERDRSKCLDAGCNEFVTKPIEMQKLIKAIGRYLKVVPVAKTPTTKEDATAAANRALLVQKFYQELPAELVQMEQAIERQDRDRIKDISKLVLGTAAAAGLKEVAAEAAKLLMSAEGNQSWIVLRQALTEFGRASQSESTSQAA